jgi:hypothetical protein
MPLTIPDLNSALIVIDLQKGIVNGSVIHPIFAEGWTDPAS